MDSLYVVISISGGAELEVCELHEELQPALGRAHALAHFAAVHDPAALKFNKEETESDGTRRYIFLDTYYNYVAVHQKKIIKKDILDLSKDADVVVANIQAALTPSVKDNPNDHTLPGGWSYSGKPITMGDLINDPYNVLATSQLHEAQRWALIIARVTKRPNFSILVPNVGTLDQQKALDALKNRTPLGQVILSLECAWLDEKLHDERFSFDEESSSESSEDD